MTVPANPFSSAGYSSCMPSPASPPTIGHPGPLIAYAASFPLISLPLLQNTPLLLHNRLRSGSIPSPQSFVPFQLSAHFTPPPLSRPLPMPSYISHASQAHTWSLPQ
eukprot:2412074-Rhodomonas_salina.1